MILPDWRGRQLSQVLADTVRSDARYLAQILPQYRSGRRDDLDYRIARRDAHNANAALSGVLAQHAARAGRPARGDAACCAFSPPPTCCWRICPRWAVTARRWTPPKPPRPCWAVASWRWRALDRVADALTDRSSPAPDAPVEDAQAVEARLAGDDTATLVMAQLDLVASQGHKLAALTRELPSD